MDLHTHSGHLVTQLETLLLLVRTQLDDVEASDPVNGYAAFECSLMHLRNACDLLGTWAAGADFALSDMLPILAAHADHGAIAPTVMDAVCAPLYAYLGERYVHAAMATQSKG